MKIKSIHREILENSKDFKLFLDEKGPFKYALTCNEYPAVLLEQEEWIFASDLNSLLKDLMQFGGKMKFVKSPFNPANSSILRPETLSIWKINNFPEEWNAFVCDIFVPEGHLTLDVFKETSVPENEMTPLQVEELFFECLESKIEQLGYLLFKPREGSKYAAIKKYLAQWEEDDMDAGL
jgi:hypothetical protein